MCSLRAPIQAVAWAAAFALLGPAAVRAADGFGDISGQFVLEGDIPEPKLIIKKNDPAVKDGEVCAAFDQYGDDLVVDEKTKGIANVFIYLRSASVIHPDLAASKEKKLVFDQENCRFIPHALFVRTDQAVQVLSDDPIAHNTHTFPIRNQPVNFLLKPKDRDGISVANPMPEILPIQVKCDIHPWMLAYWLILDHPYAAVSDAQGKFTIEKLPVGEHSFRIWHERVGYLEREFKVTVAAGKNPPLKPYLVPAARLEQK